MEHNGCAVFCLQPCSLGVERNCLYFSKANSLTAGYTVFTGKKSLVGVVNFCVSSIFQPDVHGTDAVLVS